MSDFTFPTGTAGNTRPFYDHNTLPAFEAAFVSRCYLCDTPGACLQCITVGKRAGKHICGGCLDEALRSVDGD